MRLQDEINQVIIHELIHAYDDCVTKNMNWRNCAHHACSEIRANHLSGDCHYKRELLRGFMKIRGHEQLYQSSQRCVHWESCWRRKWRWKENVDSWKEKCISVKVQDGNTGILSVAFNTAAHYKRGLFRGYLGWIYGITSKWAPFADFPCIP